MLRRPSIGTALVIGDGGNEHLARRSLHGREGRATCLDGGKTIQFETFDNGHCEGASFAPSDYVNGTCYDASGGVAFAAACVLAALLL